MYGNYGYDTNYLNSTTSNVADFAIWTIVALVIAIIGGITLYFVFLKNNKKYDGFVKKLHEFFNFKTLLVEEIFKITYLCGAIFITLYSFGLIKYSFVAFLLMLIVGNLVLRVCYELSILLIKICQNTSEINKKLK